MDIIWIQVNRAWNIMDICIYGFKPRLFQAPFRYTKSKLEYMQIPYLGLAACSAALAGPPVRPPGRAQVRNMYFRYLNGAWNERG